MWFHSYFKGVFNTAWVVIIILGAKRFISSKNMFHYSRKSAASISTNNYFIASGLVGEPTAPVMGKAGATNINS